MSAESLPPPKLAVVIAQQLVADIVGRSLVAGDRLPAEHEMLAEYAVARGTLREALRLLELLGVVELRRGAHGGPFVRQPNASGLEIALRLLLQFQGAPFSTIVEARSALEPMTARLAAQRMTSVELAELAHSNELMEHGLDDAATFRQVNELFHHQVAHGSGNVMFGFMLSAMHAILDGSTMGIHYPERRRRAVLAAHQAIYEALAAGDADAADAAMRRHIDEYANHARRKFPGVLDRPIVWTGDAQTSLRNGVLR